VDWHQHLLKLNQRNKIAILNEFDFNPITILTFLENDYIFQMKAAALLSKVKLLSITII